MEGEGGITYVFGKYQGRCGLWNPSPTKNGLPVALYSAPNALESMGVHTVRVPLGQYYGSARVPHKGRLPSGLVLGAERPDTWQVVSTKFTNEQKLYQVSGRRQPPNAKRTP